MLFQIVLSSFYKCPNALPDWHVWLGDGSEECHLLRLMQCWYAFIYLVLSIRVLI